MGKKNQTPSPHPPIAIVGMDCLFPKAGNLKEYWRMICQGEDGISEVPSTHWSPEDYFDKDPKKTDSTYCRRGGFLSPIDFDPLEYGIPPAALEATDTSQLLSLVVAKNALKDAGYDDQHNFDRDRVSVILGVTGTLELVIPLGARLGHPYWRKALEDSGVDAQTAEKVVAKISDSYVPWQENSFPGLLGNVVAGRIANRLNLGGTNCVVDAACASSLSACNLAMLELANGSCDMVVTGGVDTFNDIFMYMCFSKTPAFSPSGDTRPFSKDADGTIIGEGIGMVVLKRLEDAQRDKNRIYAVIKNLGTSSDGKSQSIYAPRSEGQAKALRRAYEGAGIEPSSIQLVEAHGTGTKVGDASEFKALSEVYRENQEEGKWCALGSVKSQIGHTKAAAGAAGLIKAALALHHKVLPTTIKVKEPNEKLKIEESPFYLNTQTRPWASSDTPRRSAVSAFGFGGSNFHMVLEEYSEKKETFWNHNIELIALTASSQAELIARLQEWQNFIQKNSHPDDWARRAYESRLNFTAEHPQRLLVVWQRKQNLGQLLKRAQERLAQNHATSWNEGNIYYGTSKLPGKMAFLFPGQGSQYVSMGQEMSCLFSEFFQSLEEGNFSLKEKGTKKTLLDYIYPQPVFSKEDRQEQENELTQTEIAQPSIGSVSVGFLKTLQKFGVSPEATAGHSYGELVALFAAGVIDQETLHQLSQERGRLMAKSSGAKEAMLAVSAPLSSIENIIAEEKIDLVLANRNTPLQGVLSGSEEEIDKAKECFQKHGHRAKKLPVSRAFHSPLVKDAQAPFEKFLHQQKFHSSEIPVWANSTANVYPEGKAGQKVLAEQLTSPVNFVDIVEKLFQSGFATFVEVGPRSVLSGLVKSTLQGKKCHVVTLDASQGKDNLNDLAKALAHLSALGYPVDLSKWGEEVPQRKKQKMTVPLVGANYRSPQKVDTATTKLKSETKKQESTSKKVLRVEPKQNAKEVNINKTISPEVSRNTRRETSREIPMNTNISGTNGKKNGTHHAPVAPPVTFAHHASLNEAFKVAQQGLLSMQTLQKQTAQTHEKFLQGQEKAYQTLQSMIASSQGLWQAGAPLNVAGTATPMFPAPTTTTTTTAGVVQDSNATSVAPVNRISSFTAPAAQTMVSVAPVAPVAPTVPVASVVSVAEERKEVSRSSVSAVSSSPASEIKTASFQEREMKEREMKQSILEVVSELTGYPVDMLEMNMDIEGDLGIDSIKRVEILSSLRQRMPGMSAVDPDHMGTLRTLQEIADYSLGLSGSASSSTSASSSAPESTVDAPNENLIEGAILEVVSQLTGYPTDMLEMGMDIEGDLGIDSIKRVEILSSLKERMPEMNSIDPDHMGTLRTLQEMAQYCFSLQGSSVSSPNSASPSVSSSNNGAQVEGTILEVVSELTGYPVDMLEMEMDIEGDLGIDSIKRVEILSSVKQRMPELSAVDPDHMGTLRTLGQIADYYQGIATETSPSESSSEPISDSINKASSSSSLSSSKQAIEKELLQVVSELTGYPSDMLEWDMDLEGDLGIDSIKRVEILSALKQKIPALEKLDPEHLNTLRTLREILEYSEETTKVSSETTSLRTSTPVSVPSVEEVSDEKVDRQVISLVERERSSAKLDFFQEGEFWVTETSHKLSSKIVEEFKKQGYQARLVSKSKLPLKDSTTLSAFIYIAEQNAKEDSSWDEDHEDSLTNAFELAQQVAPVLERSTQKGAVVFATITQMDGAFGFTKSRSFNPIHGGLAGLAKTASIEWKNVISRALDIDPRGEKQKWPAREVVAELVSSGPVEVGLSQKKRYELDLILRDAPKGESLISSEDVIVISGGARGVTAEVALALAKEKQPTLVLLGRSEIPDSLPEWLDPLEKEGEIKKAILEHQFKGRKISPSQLQKTFRIHMAQREIHRTLEQIASTGAKVHYYSLDVRGERSVERTFQKIRTQCGSITGIIHGAGVLEDKLIVDKTKDQFNKVMSTKVKGLRRLLQSTAQDPLKYIVLFSSVSGRMGNQGQVDYSMANEVLNKAAQVLAHNKPKCRVVSLNWGPWDGGMVTDSLKKEFRKRGVKLIPLKAGAQCLIDELVTSPENSVEVVLGSGLEAKSSPSSHVLSTTPKKNREMAVVFEREIDVARYPILKSHVIGGKPVVPLALMIEWLGHGALHQNPGLVLDGYEDLRVMKGIRLDQQPQKIQLQVSSTEKKEGSFEVEVQLVGSGENHSQVIHARAKAVLKNALSSADKIDIPAKLSQEKYPHKVESAYQNILFHGQDLHAIEKLVGFSKAGMVAHLKASPAPKFWMKEAHRSQWVNDPMILDGAFQMAILWCFQEQGKVSLPSYVGTYTQFAKKFPKTGVVAYLEVKEVSDHMMRGNFTFVDQKNQVLAQLKNYECTMDASLHQVFQKKSS